MVFRCLATNWRRWLPLWHRRHLKTDQYTLLMWIAASCYMPHHGAALIFLLRPVVYVLYTVVIQEWHGQQDHDWQRHTTFRPQLWKSGSKWPCKDPPIKINININTRCAVVIKHLYRYIIYYVSRKCNHIYHLYIHSSWNIHILRWIQLNT